MIDPVSLLIKTAANYVAFKSVKTSIDLVWDRDTELNTQLKNSQCQFCLKVWSYNPPYCPHCYCTVMKKLFRDYDYKKEEPSAFQVDSSLKMGVI